MRGLQKPTILLLVRHRAKRFCFLNPDTEIIGNAITVMSNALYSDTMIGIVGCKLLNSRHELPNKLCTTIPYDFNQVFDAEHSP